MLKFTFSQKPSGIGHHNFQAEGEKIHGLCLPTEDLTTQSETNMHTKASSWQEGENVEESFMRVKEEPPASKFRGLHAKTPVALVMDNSYVYLKGRGFFKFCYYYLFVYSRSSCRYTSKAAVHYGEVILLPRGHISTCGDILGYHKWRDATGI